MCWFLHLSISALLHRDWRKLQVQAGPAATSQLSASGSPHPQAGPRPAPKPHGQLPNPMAAQGMWVRTLEMASGEQITRTLNVGPFSVGSPVCSRLQELGATSRACRCPGVSLAGFEVSPAFCSRWHSLVLFQALSFWNFLWENLF